MELVMKGLVIALYVLLAVHSVREMRKLKPLPMPDAQGEVGKRTRLEVVLFGTMGVMVVLISLTTLLAPWPAALFCWSISFALVVLMLRALLWRIQWGVEGFIYRDGRGRLHACSWQDVMGGERTWMNRGRITVRVTILHTREFSLVVEEKQGAAFLAELEHRCGKLQPIRPRRGPWYGRIMDVEQYEVDNVSSLGLGMAMLASTLAIGLSWLALPAVFILAWSILRRCLSEKENVPRWLVRILFAGGNYWF